MAIKLFGNVLISSADNFQQQNYPFYNISYLKLQSNIHRI